jgi:hypothetical protein
VRKGEGSGNRTYDANGSVVQCDVRVLALGDLKPGTVDRSYLARPHLGVHEGVEGEDVVL